MVLLHVMLVLGWVSSQHMWEGTVLRDKKSCCTTVCWAMSLWYCLGRGRSRAGVWGHDFVLSWEQGMGKGGEAGDPSRRDKFLVQCSTLLDSCQQLENSAFGATCLYLSSS